MAAALTWRLRRHIATGLRERANRMSSEGSSAVKSADRVLDLFELLARRSDGLSHQEIAEALEIPKSSLTQLLKTVINRGYISYSPDDKHYHLGDRFTSMARQVSRTQDLVIQALPILEEITAKTRESSALNILKGDQLQVVATVNSPQRLVSHMRLGDLAPLYATSGGKIILAHMSEAEREKYLSNVVFEAVTPKTLSSAAELRQQLDKARRTGIAYSFEEFTPGIIGLAKAVLSEKGEPVGSINVALPAVRYDPQADKLITETLVQAGQELERRIRF
jgi:DNA-binding IclR family transcriptional regulator